MLPVTNICGIQKVGPPYLYLYIQAKYQNKSKHKIKPRTCTLLLCLIFLGRVPLVQWKTTSAEQVFQTHQCRILQAVLETISSSHVKGIPLKCVLRAANNQSQMVANPGCREGVEQLQTCCSLSLLKWQHQCVVQHHHTEDSAPPWQTWLIGSFSFFTVLI